jgi:hypothetical protein
MDNDYSVEKKKLSPVALTAIIAGGVVLITAIVLISYFVFFRSESLIDTWHDEAKTSQYTFYEDNKMIVDTPYGNFIGTYVFDAKSGKGMISMANGAIDFSFENGKVSLSNGTILKRGEIEVIRMTTVATTVAETTLPETTATTEPPATTVPETAAVTTAAETSAAATTPAATTTAPIATVSFPTYSFMMPTFTVDLVFPTYYIVGTPVVGPWTDENTGEWLMDFSDDGTVTITWGTWSYGTTDYEYNIFTGEGSMTLGTTDFEFSVSGDELLLVESGGTGGQIFNRAT